jgi:fumiquinazoline A oxidase
VIDGFEAVGVSPCVGATGATIGGGVGRLGGLHGLMIDAVSSFRMVLASGQVVNVSSTSYPDLFYGMKGAGQLYGVIVETIFDTYPASNGGNFYNVDMVFAGSQLESTLSVVNSIIPSQPGELALIVLFNHGTPDVRHLTPTKPDPH